MNLRTWASIGVCAVAAWASGLNAQTPAAADYIVAVVDSDPITNSDVRNGVERTIKALTQQGIAVPPLKELQRQVLENLINERAQLHQAQDMGVRVEESAIDMAEQNMARQSQISVDELRRRLAKEGMSPTRVREKFREQIMLARLQEREVEGQIRVTDADVDRYMAQELAANTDPFARDINLAHILITVPEKATPQQVSLLESQARELRQRIRVGESFDKLVAEYSGGDRTNGGRLGLRRADRYPPLFVQATESLAPGEVSEVVRSGAGFHILRVVEKRAPTSLTRSIVQTRARHILLVPSTQLSQAAAIERLADMRKRIVSGKAAFASLAREFSQDGSAQQGGDLGWANPGKFVPEFEEVMERLAEGQVSEPVVSRFGVHLMEVTERRRVDLSPKEVRELMRNQLREIRREEAYANWARDIRERAFVEMREPPQ